MGFDLPCHTWYLLIVFRCVKACVLETYTDGRLAQRAVANELHS